MFGHCPLIPPKTRREYPYLTTKRFPLNWAVAEMVKQYLRNKRRLVRLFCGTSLPFSADRYGVRLGNIPDRKTRKRKAQENSMGSNKRRKTTSGTVRHINDDEEEEEPSDSDEDHANAGGDPDVKYVIRIDAEIPFSPFSSSQRGQRRLVKRPSQVPNQMARVSGYSCL